jgi:hypothetical protein
MGSLQNFRALGFVARLPTLHVQLGTGYSMRLSVVVDWGGYLRLSLPLVCRPPLHKA